MQGEHPRPGAEQLLSQLSGLLGGVRPRVTDGDKVEFARADVSDRRVSPQVAAAHAATSDQSDRDRVHSVLPPHAGWRIGLMRIAST